MSIRSLRLHRGLHALVLTIACFSPAALASPTPSQLIDAGLAQLGEGKAEQALGSFEQASKQDPADSEAVFFSAVALNRLGRADEALARLSAAKKLGSTHPDIPFETGWSYLMLKRWPEAIDQLTLFEKQTPGRGQTAEFLGRAHLALGNYNEAEEYFAQALQRDPDLLPTISLYRALLHQRQGNDLAARDEISTLLRTAPNTALGQLVGSNLLPFPQVRNDRPWSLTLRTAIGYNTDARGIMQIAPKVPDSSTPEQASAFARFGLDAAYAIVNLPKDRLTIGYDLQADFYARQETDPDLLDQNAYLEYWHLLSDRFSTTLRLWENYTFVGEDSFRSELAGQAALAWKIFSNFATEVSYRYAADDYLYDNTRIVNLATPPDPIVSRNLNRDGQMHTLSIAADLALPKQNARLRGGYFHTWNFAKRDDFDYHSDGLFAGLTVSLPWRIIGEAFYAHTFYRYDDPNSALKPRRPREDDLDGVTLRLTRPLNPHLSIFIEYNFNHDNSNIAGYDYHQHITSGGLIWQF